MGPATVDLVVGVYPVLEEWKRDWRVKGFFIRDTWWGCRM
jgi:hypothetical protein